jgi:hypothetical protein
MAVEQQETIGIRCEIILRDIGGNRVSISFKLAGTSLEEEVLGVTTRSTDSKKFVSYKQLNARYQLIFTDNAGEEIIPPLYREFELHEDFIDSEYMSIDYPYHEGEGFNPGIPLGTLTRNEKDPKDYRNN